MTALSVAEAGELLADAIDKQAQATDDLSELAAIYADIQKIKAAFAMASLAVEEKLAELMPEDTVETEAGVLDRRFRARSPKWDSDSLFRRLVAMARDERRIDKETGEALESEGEAVARVLKECLPVTPSTAWRTTPLKKRKIDVDEYREHSGWRTTVDIKGRNSGVR